MEEYMIDLEANKLKKEAIDKWLCGEIDKDELQQELDKINKQYGTNYAIL
jgi:hypothetical protein